VVGQSFSEIFFGNSAALGMPCPAATRETLDALMTLVERDPSTEIVVDLQSMRVTAAGHGYEITLPSAARESFLDGSWDATGLLLDNYDDIRGVAARLPYASATGF
jgi:3-isopropylmalate/(R)-2-methylmalate dehydratase small subunit